MSKSKPALGAGNVELTLDGEDIVLKPSLRVAQAISRQSGGILGAIRAVGNCEIDAISGILVLSLNLTGEEAKAMPERVWNNGMTDLIGPLCRFLGNIANGGRPVDGGQTGDDDANPPKG